MSLFITYYPLVMLALLCILYGIHRIQLVSTAVKKIIIVLCVTTNVVYISWRLLFTLPHEGAFNIVLGILLVACECIGFLQLFVFYTLVWKPSKRKAIKMSELDRLPTIDIFIATYNEPLEVLKRTIAGCVNLSYPKERIHIYLCDDGKRQSVEQLARDFDVHYLTRSDNSFAKAGNLNHAMSQTNGELILTLDADMVPLPSFLEKTVPYFKDEATAFVQVPQAFYNEDPFQYNMFSKDRIPNEQDFFMQTLQSGKDRFNAVMYVGSNTVFRRAALDEIGGFATGVITEDMATGMLLQGKFKSVSVGEVLAVGLAPESWIDLLRQRDRWSRGNIQCARKFNPLKVHGLTVMQRVLYLDGIVYWFNGLFKMIYILTPILFLLFGIQSFWADFKSIFLFWLPAFFSSYLAFKLVSNQKRSMFWSHIYETSMAFHLAGAALSELFLKKRIEFLVTPKGIQTDKRHFHLKTMIPHLIFLLLSLLVLVKTGYDVKIKGTMSADLTMINIFWVLYNGAGLLMAMLVAFDRPRYRKSERFIIEKEGHLRSDHQDHNIPCFLLDMSDSGARLSVPLDQAPHLYQGQTQLFFSKDEGVACDLVWSYPEGDQLLIGVSFNQTHKAEYLSLIRFLFTREHVAMTNREEKSFAVRTLFRFLRETEKMPMALRRKLMRRPLQDVTGTLTYEGRLEEKTAIIIHDISLSGCRMETAASIELNEKVMITIDTESVSNQPAIAVWTSRKRGRTIAGLKFVQPVPEQIEEREGTVS
ncbi:glycosyltransferase [Bacillus sp. NPDC077027]|uniref:glycosyltransferase n=1 Tax=Bacillus sp. NPDC077027 TaxID=3390548 RepID=UPI003D076389